MGTLETDHVLIQGKLLSRRTTFEEAAFLAVRPLGTFMKKTMMPINETNILTSLR